MEDPFNIEVKRLQKTNKTFTKGNNKPGYDNTFDARSFAMNVPDFKLFPGETDIKTKLHQEEGNYSKFPSVIGDLERSFTEINSGSNLLTPTYNDPNYGNASIEGMTGFNRVDFNRVDFNRVDLKTKRIDQLMREIAEKKINKLRDNANIDIVTKDYISTGPKRSGMCAFGAIGDSCDDAKIEETKQKEETARAYLAFKRAQSSDKREIAQAEARLREAIAEKQLRAQEAYLRYLENKSSDEREIRQAEFERDRALAEMDRSAKEAAEITARMQSENKKDIELAREETNRQNSRDANATAQEIARLTADTDQEKIRQTAESERDKISSTMMVDLANTAAKERNNRDKLDAESRYQKDKLDAELRAVTVNAELEERIRISDNNTLLERDRIAAGVENARSERDKDKAISLALIDGTAVAARSTAKGIADALKITMPNGIEGILGETNNIVTNLTAQNARMQTEQIRLNQVQSRLQAEQNQKFTDALLEAQRQERILTLQKAEEESLRTQRMLEQLKTVMQDKANQTKKPSEILSKLISNIAVESIMKCQSSVKMNQNIGGAGGKIVIGGKNNQLDINQKQVVTFSAECGQDIEQLTTMQNKMAETVKDFIQLQAKTTILGMEKAPTEYASDIKSEVQNLFSSKAMTEIIADFEAAQSVSNIEITGEGNKATFNQEQVLDILMKTVQNVANKLEVVNDLQKNVDKNANVNLTITEDIFTPLNIFLILLFIIISIMIVMKMMKRGKPEISVAPGV